MLCSSPERPRYRLELRDDCRSPRQADDTLDDVVTTWIRRNGLVDVDATARLGVYRICLELVRLQPSNLVGRPVMLVNPRVRVVWARRVSENCRRSPIATGPSE